MNPAVSDDRIDKPEYKSSEDECKDRLLLLNIHHPNINNSHENLNQHVSEFLSYYLFMEEIEIPVKYILTCLFPEERQQKPRRQKPQTINF